MKNTLIKTGTAAMGAFKIVAFVFRSFLLHCQASYLSMTKATILKAPFLRMVIQMRVTALFRSCTV